MFAKTRSQGTAHEQERSVSPAVVLPSRDSQDAEEEGLLVKAERLSSGLSGRMPNLSPFHAGVCCLLSVQNSSYVLLRRYSSGVLHEEASAQSILAVGEVLKLCFSWLMILRESPDDPGEARLHDSAKRGPRWFAETSLKLVRTSAKMAVRRALARSRPSARRPASSLAALAPAGELGREVAGNLDTPAIRPRCHRTAAAAATAATATSAAQAAAAVASRHRPGRCLRPRRCPRSSSLV